MSYPYVHSIFTLLLIKQIFLKKIIKGSVWKPDSVLIYNYPWFRKSELGIKTFKNRSSGRLERTKIKIPLGVVPLNPQDGFAVSPRSSAVVWWHCVLLLTNEVLQTWSKVLLYWTLTKDSYELLCMHWKILKFKFS